jgi:hypothetical protein
MIQAFFMFGFFFALTHSPFFIYLKEIDFSMILPFAFYFR